MIQAAIEQALARQDFTRDDAREVMAVRHRELPAAGVQFHPESVLTPDGPALARNFLEGKL